MSLLRRSPTLQALAAALLLGAVAAALLLDSDSETVTAYATIGLALVTVVLAVATVWLAWTTRATLQAQERSLLVDIPPSAPRPADMSSGSFKLKFKDPADPNHFPHTATIDPRCAYAAGTSKGVFVSFPLRNVGRGLAQIKSAELPDFPDLQLEGNLGPPNRPRHFVIRKRQVPVDETTRIDIVVLEMPEDQSLLAQLRKRVNDEGGFPIRVRYSDRSGSQKLSVFVRLSPGRLDKQRYVNVLEHD